MSQYLFSSKKKESATTINGWKYTILLIKQIYAHTEKWTIHAVYFKMDVWTVALKNAVKDKNTNKYKREEKAHITSVSHGIAVFLPDF